MKRILTLISLVALVASGAFAADLTVISSFNITGKDAVKSSFTVKGPLGSVENDSVDPAKVDIVGGASLKKGTETWNLYRPDATDKKAAQFPAGFQNLVKYAVSNIAQFRADGLKVTKAADGVITILFAHRGTAFKIVTDKTGKLDLAAGDMKKRAIGDIIGDDQVFAKDFAPSGKIADLNFAKVWDTSVTGAKSIDGSTKKTADIFPDYALSATPFLGVAQLTLVGDVLTIKGEFTLKK